MIKGFTPRLYQETIFATATEKNTLVVLPTGMGKSIIFVLLAAARLQSFPKSKVLVLAPTKPLAEQHVKTIEKFTDVAEVVLFTGAVSPEKRMKMWEAARIVVSTPQGLENDIIARRINLAEVSLLTIDECHRAVKDYAYVWVAKQYQQKARYPRILGLTASPGDDLEKITEVCQNLFIEEVEVRTQEDSDVKPYVQEVETSFVKVELSESMKQVQKDMKEMLKARFAKLKEWGVLRRKEIDYVSKKELLALSGELRSRAAKGEKDYTMWTALSVLAEIMKMFHALELLESQGIRAVYTYLDRMNSEGGRSKVKAVRNLVQDPLFRQVFGRVVVLHDRKVVHPKLLELENLITQEMQQPTAKIIVFNNYRDSASEVVDALNKLPGVEAKLFVGQQKRGETGMSQKVQKAILDEFREGLFNVLVATSIGEEGLDIPQVDTVIFYEPVPSAIRTVQRRGRTGRLDKGKLIVLVTKGTRDEGIRWSAHHKEKRMHRLLSNLKGKLKIERKEQSLTSFVEKDIVIHADHREKSSGVIKELLELGVKVELDQLQVADYVLSDTVGVELKKVDDFVASIIDGRLLEQLPNLRRSYPRPVLIIEGEEDLYAVRNVHKNAIRGMLSTIAVSYCIPILWTRNAKDTAGLLATIAKREQGDTSTPFVPRADKKQLSLKEQQEYVMASFPGVGPGLAKPLLTHFKTIKNFVNAGDDELQVVDKIGKKKAEDLRRVMQGVYEG